MKKTFYLLVALLVVVVALGLVACGGAPATPAPVGGSGSGAAPAKSESTSAMKGDSEKGKQAFTTCSACHGPEGKGIQGLGKDFTASEFVKGQTDDELVAFIKVGRDPSDPLNTTGVAMPPKGGNPALNDQDLYDLVAFIRTLQQ
jgi:mono/diheme cytochrome c family protein